MNLKFKAMKKINKDLQYNLALIALLVEGVENNILFDVDKGIKVVKFINVRYYCN